MRKCFIFRSFAELGVASFGNGRSELASMDKNDTVEFFRFSSYVDGVLESQWSRSADGDVELKINDDMRLPGHGISEDDEREIQAPHHVGSQGRSASLWRDQKWSPARS